MHCSHIWIGLKPKTSHLNQANLKHSRGERERRKKGFLRCSFLFAFVWFLFGSFCSGWGPSLHERLAVAWKKRVIFSKASALASGLASTHKRCCVPFAFSSSLRRESYTVSVPLYFHPFTRQLPSSFLRLSVGHQRANFARFETGLFSLRGYPEEQR